MTAGAAQAMRTASEPANDTASVEPVRADVGTIAVDRDVAVAAAPQYRCRRGVAWCKPGHGLVTLRRGWPLTFPIADVGGAIHARA